MQRLRSNALSGIGDEDLRRPCKKVDATLFGKFFGAARRGVAKAPQGVSKSVLLLAIAAVAQAAFAVDPLPASRKYNWTYTGVPGGIPTLTNICASFTPSNASGISSAYGSCSNGVIYLGPGTYSGLNLTLNRSNVVIRGAGADQTTLTGCQPIQINGGYLSSAPNIPVTGGGAKGSSTLTVSSASGLSVGTIVLVDRADPAYVYGPQQPRVTRQQNAITAISGTTLTFRNPWVIDFTSAAGATIRNVDVMANHIGVENLKIDHSSCTASGNMFYIQFCDSCWIKGVESYMPIGYHFAIIGSLNFEVRDSYIHDAQGSGGPNNGGLSIYSNNNASWGAANSNWKVENNIFNKTFPAVEMQNGDAAMYVGYNFFYGSQAQVGTYLVSWTMDDNHGGGDLGNLYEGNIGEQFGGDGYFGGDVGAVAFRNHFLGVNRNDLTTARSTDSVPVRMKRLMYFTSLIGNVIGNSVTSYNSYAQSNSGCSLQSIYEFGFPNIGNCGTTDATNYQPAGNWTYPDANVGATTFRWGNYDYYNKSVQWNTSEVPTTDALGGGLYAVPVPSDHVLPSSYYYSSRPAWFNTGVPWPPIGPDVTGGTASFGDTSGHVNDIPAELCWNSRNLAGGGTFNAAACYPLSASATPPPTPSPSLAAPANIHVTP